MSVPAEYTDCKRRIVAFRDKLLSELVGGRVKAGLDAGHAGMRKFSSVVDALSVTPYLFGEVSRRAYALKLSGRDVGTGKIAQASVEYVLGEVEYPLQPPFNIPRRRLPQVDVFTYDVVKDLDLLDKTNTNSLKSFVLLQASSGTFEETPEAENTVYDYYELVPNVRTRAKYHIINQQIGYGNYKQLHGEHVYMKRNLTKKGTMERNDYFCEVWLDSMIYSDIDVIRPVAFAFHVYLPPSPAPSAVLNCCGQRLAPYSNGLFMEAPIGRTIRQYADGETAQLPEISGFGMVGDLGNLIESAVVWSALFTLRVRKSPITGGTTDPPEGDYEKIALEIVTLKAFPASGYKFKQWERDGVKYSEASEISFSMDRDYMFMALFEPL